jgi:hypothetical protein
MYYLKLLEPCHQYIEKSSASLIKLRKIIISSGWTTLCWNLEKCQILLFIMLVSGMYSTHIYLFYLGSNAHKIFPILIIYMR